MAVRVDDAQLEEKSRLAAVALALYTLRSMEEWRRIVDDHDCVMIMLAVVAIIGERLLRTDESDFASLARPLPRARQPKCNIASIAHAAGLNRETTRRKVNDLVRMGLLARLEDGGITFREGLIQSPEVREAIRRQLVAAAALADRLMRLGILAPGPGPGPVPTPARGA